MRISLAAVLFNQPDLLLLDEPTNYLDLEGTIWLQNYLITYPHTVLIISHDRDLLNNCVNSILHLEDKNLNFTPEIMKNLPKLDWLNLKANFQK